MKNIEYLSQTEHAERLGIARTTVWRAQKEGQFKTAILGRRTYYIWIDGEPQYNKKED